MVKSTPNLSVEYKCSVLYVNNFLKFFVRKGFFSEKFLYFCIVYAHASADGQGHYILEKRHCTLCFW